MVKKSKGYPARHAFINVYYYPWQNGDMLTAKRDRNQELPDKAVSSLGGHSHFTRITYLNSNHAQFYVYITPSSEADKQACCPGRRCPRNRKLGIASGMTGFATEQQVEQHVEAGSRAERLGCRRSSSSPRPCCLSCQRIEARIFLKDETQGWGERGTARMPERGGGKTRPNSRCIDRIRPPLQPTNPPSPLIPSVHFLLHHPLHQVTIKVTRNRLSPDFSHIKATKVLPSACLFEFPVPPKIGGSTLVFGSRFNFSHSSLPTDLSLTLESWTLAGSASLRL